MLYYYGIILANALISCFVANEMALNVLKEKNANRGRFFLTNALYMALFADALISDYAAYVLWGVLLAGSLILSLNYQTSVKRRIQCAGAYVLLTGFLYAVIYLLFAHTMHMNEMLLIVNGMEYFTIKAYEKIVQGGSRTNIALMVALPVFFLGMLLLVLKVVPMGTYLRVCFIFGIMLMNMFLVVLYSDLANRNQMGYEQQILLEQNQSYQRQIDQIMKSDAAMRQTRHDMKNHISVIEQMVEQQEYDRLAAYVQTLKADTFVSSRYIETENIEFDAIFNNKLELAGAQKIPVDYKVVIPKCMNIKPYDIAVIIGNLFDNAIRAAEVLPQQERWIYCRVLYEKGTLRLDLRNSCGDKVEFNDSHLPVTTKQDKQMHGIGLKNVKRTVEKYQGDIEIHAEDGAYQTIITLYVDEQSAH